MAASDDRHEPAGRPGKRCVQCGERTARAYHWWIEETSVAFVCDTCRQGSSRRPAEPDRSSPARAPLPFAFDDLL